MKVETMRPTPKWTRLYRDPIFSQAEEMMGRNRARMFHNFDHPCRIYTHALETFNFPYDRALDLAILTHDVVFDSDQDRELRSILWLRDHLPLGESDPDFPQAKLLIMSTIDHKMGDDPRMVFVDLADFIDPAQADINTDLLRREAKSLHGVGSDSFTTSCEEYLGRLIYNFKIGSDNLPFNLRTIHSNIVNGISRTRSILNQEVMDDMRSGAHV